MVSTADLQRLTSLAEVQHLSQELIAAERSCGVDLDGILARRSQLESSFLLLKAPIAQVRARVHALGASVHALCPISPPTTLCTRIALPLTQSCGADPCAYALQAAALRFRAIACVCVHAHTGGLPTACSTTLPAHRTWMWCAPTASSCWATRRARRSWQTTSVARYLGGRPCLLCIDRMRRWVCPASLLLQAGPGSDVGHHPGTCSASAPCSERVCARRSCTAPQSAPTCAMPAASAPKSLLRPTPTQVRRLDLAQTRVEEVLASISLILDRTACINGVQVALEAEV